MAEITADCPRCGVKMMTFDVIGVTSIPELDSVGRYEAQCGCRKCRRTTLFKLRCADRNSQNYFESNGMAHMIGSLDDLLHVIGYVSIRDNSTAVPPSDLPASIHNVFAEGATCMAVGCYNAAATMFRLCIDLATKAMLPEGDENGLNNRVRRNLGFRLPWLFENGKLPHSLQDLSTCIKEDGNDGAHEGTLEQADAEDILDFTRMLLERIYTEPAKLDRANERRNARRAGA